MREDDDVGRYLPLLRRIIILLAVIVAVPVVLWTITAFVRTYVSPPKIPTFRQLAATASTNASPNTKNDAGSSPQGPQAAADGGKPATPPLVTVEARATTADGRDAPKGPFLGDRALEGSAPAATQPAPPVSPALGGAPANLAVAAQQPAATTEPAAEAAAMPAAAAISGPIPVPRRRPHVTVAAETEPAAPAAETTRMASAGPIPIPRPRPEAAGPGVTPDDSGNNPIEFIQNLFGGGSK